MVERDRAVSSDQDEHTQETDRDTAQNVADDLQNSLPNEMLNIGFPS